jgi:hypothetical protein
MNGQADPDRSIHAWLAAEAPDRAPARLITDTRDRLRTTRQRRALWPAWRSRAGNGVSKPVMTAAVAAVAVVLLIVVNLIPASKDAGQSALPPSSPTQTSGPGQSPAALVFPAPGPLPIGDYGAIVKGVSFTFSVPLNGWASSPTTEGRLDNSYYPGHAWVRFWAPDNVYSDPCTHTPMTPRVGPSAADLASAMTMIPGTVASGPIDTTVGGFPAKYLVLTLENDIGCQPDTFYLWDSEGEGSGNGPRWPDATGSTIRVWIVDVDGVRFVIDSDVWMPTNAQLQQGDDPLGAVSDIARMVFSTRIVGFPTAVGEYVDRVLTICRSTSDRFSSDPDVVGGFREFAPQFASLDDAAAHAESAIRISNIALEELRALPMSPEISKARVDEVYAVLESAIDVLRQVPEAARAGDRARVTSLMSEAYRLTNSGVSIQNEPLGLRLLAPSLYGCRLPSAGG